MRNYLSFGGGVNSVALHLLLLDQGVDFESVFVNHGTDWPETYDYVAGFQWWLKVNGHKPITILRPEYQGFQVLHEYCEDNKIMPATWPRWCTSRFKVRPIEKYYKKPCFQFIGIDAGESHRAKWHVSKSIENRWPLIENDIDRNGCIAIIKKYNLPVPPKSGCFICPFQRRSQWLKLRRENPCLFQRAVELEKLNNDYRKKIGKQPFYLSANRMALTDVVNENQGKLFEEMEYPPCQCGL